MPSLPILPRLARPRVARPPGTRQEESIASVAQHCAWLSPLRLDGDEFRLLFLATAAALKALGIRETILLHPAAGREVLHRRDEMGWECVLAGHFVVGYVLAVQVVAGPY
jgi:hypothetical protein